MILESYWKENSVSWNRRIFLRFFWGLIWENIKILFRAGFWGWRLERVGGFFWENIRKAFFWENIGNFLILELESSISLPKHKEFFWGVDFFYFLGLGLKGSIPQNIRCFFRVFISWNIRNFFRGFCFLNFSNTRASVSWNIRNSFRLESIFSSLGKKVHQVALKYTTMHTSTCVF